MLAFNGFSLFFFLFHWPTLKFPPIHSTDFLVPNAGQWRLMHFYCSTSCKPPSKAETDARACRSHLGLQLQRVLHLDEHFNKAQPESSIMCDTDLQKIFIGEFNRHNTFWVFHFYCGFYLCCNTGISLSCGTLNKGWMVVLCFPFTSCLTQGYTPALLQVPVEKHLGVPTWTSKVCLNDNSSYKQSIT